MATKIIAGAAQQVVLVDGSEVTLADGSEVTLAAGTEVSLAAGTEVALAAGSEVSITSGDIVSVQSGDSPAIDAFGRNRVSNPFTLFDSKQIFDDSTLANNVENFPLFFDNQETLGSGTATAFDIDRASTTLSVSNLTAGTRVRQTKQRFNYQPGKSKLIILTLRPEDTGSGITKEFGYFDENNGVMFRIVDGTWQVNIRSNVTGSPVDNPISQTNWNLDNLDGTSSSSNPSGLLLLKTAVQIFFIDIEWLGVGRVRCGMVINGLIYYVHEFLHANISSSVYMSTPNLPVRVEIANDGTGAADSIETICSTVISEGGVNPNGIVRSGSIGIAAASAIQCGVVDTAYAVCGIRLKTNYLGAFIQELSVSALETTGGSNPFLWQLHFNPTLTTGLTYADVSNSGVQFGAGLPAGDVITVEGSVISCGYISGSTKAEQVSISSALRLGSLIDGTRDELILSVRPGTTNQDIFGALTWRETW